jgi:hypothetical protein
LTGDGLYFTLARFAVRVHRWNLAIFYYGPRSFFVSLSSFVWSFKQTPPVLFLMAIIIRQIIGKVVLGAKLPDKIVDETAASFYGVWTHLRSDMYVVLCGLLVGLAWSHNHQAGSPYGFVSTASISDEL